MSRPTGAPAATTGTTGASSPTLPTREDTLSC